MLMVTMSRMLAELLGVSEKLFASDLRRLEISSGSQSEDVRLISDIIRKTKSKTKELGLDPNDSTAAEIYHAIQNLLVLHDEFLNKRIGISAEDDTTNLLQKIKTAVYKMDTPNKAWVIKHSSAKRILKKHPPKNAMRALGYKSLDSMLKREPVEDVIAAARLVDSSKWLETYLSEFSKLLPMDFEDRRIDIKVVDPKKWSQLGVSFSQKNHHNISVVREMGAILLMPVAVPLRPGLTIGLTALLLHNITEVRLYSAYYKLHQMQANLGKIIAASIMHDRDTHVFMSGQKIHWRVAYRHFGKSTKHPEVLEPHVMPEDLFWRKAEEVLYKIEPALYFWNDLDYVGLSYMGKPVSFNLIDAAINAINNLNFDNRTYSHFQSALWNELFARYIKHPAHESYVLQQLDIETADNKNFMTASI